MQSYGDLWPVPTKRMISGREAYGAYTKFATETANLAITVAKSFYLLAIPTFGSECDRPVARATRRAKRRQYPRGAPGRPLPPLRHLPAKVRGKRKVERGKRLLLRQSLIPFLFPFSSKHSPLTCLQKSSSPCPQTRHRYLSRG